MLAAAVPRPAERCGAPPLAGAHSDADAALRCAPAQPRLEQERIGRVHLQPHQLVSRGPAAPGVDPAEVEDAPAALAVAANTEVIGGAFGAEVGAAERMLEHADGSLEVLEAGRKPGRYRHGADQSGRPVGGNPPDIATCTDALRSTITTNCVRTTVTPAPARPAQVVARSRRARHPAHRCGARRLRSKMGPRAAGSASEPPPVARRRRPRTMTGDEGSERR